MYTWAPDRWISIGGKAVGPTPAVGDHPGGLPVSVPVVQTRSWLCCKIHPLNSMP